MRGDVQETFKATPHNKQVLMFTATLSKEMRLICKKFMHNVMSSPQSFPRGPVFVPGAAAAAAAAACCLLAESCVCAPFYFLS